MNREQAMRAVTDEAQVVARYGTGMEMGRGRVIAYSIVPTLLIEAEDGTRFSWRHDMVEPATAAEQVVARLDSYSQAQHVDGINQARERSETRRAAHREKAEAAVARVQALADEWIGMGMCALYESPLEMGQMVRDAINRDA